MEILILAMIMGVVVKRGAEDLIHAARGNTPHRYAAASQRRKSGAAGRYWGQVWDDVWTDKAAKRAARRSGATPDRTPKPRGAATRFVAGLAQDGRRAAGRRWDEGWSRLDEKRRTKATRPRPGQVTVPGTVVPNAEDGDGDRPQDRPVPEPRLVPDGDGGTDLRFGEDEDDPTGVSSCPECEGTVLVDDEVCLSCRDRQEQRNQHYEDQDAFRAASAIEDGWDETGAVRTFANCPSCHRDMHLGPDGICSTCQHQKNAPPPPPVYNGWDYDPSPATPNPTEGPTTMSITVPTGEVTSLSQTIRFCEDSAQAYRAQVHAIEQTQATLSAEEVSGPAADAFAQAMEQSNSAAASMEAAASEFKKHLVVQEAYDSVDGAGTKKFVTAGR